MKQNILLSVSQIRNKERAINCMLKEVNYLEIMSVTLSSSLVEYDTPLDWLFVNLKILL